MKETIDKDQDVSLAIIGTKLDNLGKDVGEIKTDVKTLKDEVHANNGLKSRLDKLEAKYDLLLKVVMWGLPLSLTALAIAITLIKLFL